MSISVIFAFAEQELLRSGLQRSLNIDSSLNSWKHAIDTRKLTDILSLVNY